MRNGNKRHRKGHPAAKLSAAVAVAAVIIIIAYYFYASSGGAAHLPDLGDVDAVFGSGVYSMQSPAKCVSSSLLYNNSRINSVCSVVFAAARNLSSAPYEITAFSYSFASTSAASAFIGNVVPAFNNTPWPTGAKAFGNVSSANGITLYYTTVSYRTSTPFQTVATIYASAGNLVLGVSALVSEGQNLTAAQTGAATLLYRQYLKYSGRPA
jgi:hypothetical protein